MSKKRKIVYWLMTALFLALGLNLLLIGMGVLETDRKYQEAAASLYSVDIWIGLLRYGILAPLLEELVFRGIIFQSIRKLWRWEGGAVVSALLFGIYHGNMVQLVYAFCLGLIFAFAYEDTGSFGMPMLLHGTVNVVIYLASSFCIFPGGGVALLLGAVMTVAGIVLCIKRIRTCF